MKKPFANVPFSWVSRSANSKNKNHKSHKWSKRKTSNSKTRNDSKTLYNDRRLASLSSMLINLSQIFMMQSGKSMTTSSNKDLCINPRLGSKRTNCLNRRRMKRRIWALKTCGEMRHSNLRIRVKTWPWATTHARRQCSTVTKANCWKARPNKSL